MFNSFTYYCIKIALISLKALPWRLRYQIGLCLGYLATFFSKRELLIAKLQLNKILKLKDYEKIAVQSFQNIPAHLFASLNVQQILSDPKVKITISDQKLFDEIKESQKLTIALTAHYCNWDLLASYFSSVGAELLTIGRHLRNPALHRILKEQREAQGIQTLWRNSLGSNRKLVEMSKSNQIIAALIDQDTKVKAKNSLFFGHNVACPISLIELGLKNDANLIFAIIRQIDLENYEIVIKEIKSKELNVVLEEYHRHLEPVIKQKPNDWVWFHKRWRTTKEKKVLSSREYINFLKTL